MMKFEYQFDQDTAKVTVELSAQADLTDACQAFEDFLRGSGYAFDGHVCIEEDDWDEKTLKDMINN